MKKLLLMLSLIIVALTGWAQTADVAAKINGKCPVDMNNGLTLKAVTIVDNQVVFDYTVADEVFANLGTMQEILHDAMVAELVSSPDALTRQLLTECRRSSTPIVQRFTNSKGATLDILIKPAEMN